MSDVFSFSFMMMIGLELARLFMGFAVAFVVMLAIGLFIVAQDIAARRREKRFAKWHAKNRS